MTERKWKSLQAKVAGVPRPTDVAVNVGTSRGVEQGDEGTLFETVEVRDPDTNEKLGALQYPKLRLELYLVTDKYSVGRVIDRAPMDPRTLFTPRKTATTDPFDETPNSVYVEIGEAVVIKAAEATQEPEGELDESPF